MPRSAEPERDWYAVLELPPGAGPDAVKTAHRRLARRWHPDTNPDPEAHRVMTEINRAREVLLDPALRAAFDRSRARQSAVRARQRPAPSQPPVPPTTPAPPGREVHIRARPQGSATNPRPASEPAAAPRRPAPLHPRAHPDHDRDWYAFLGVKPAASAAEIRAALGRKAIAMQGAPISAVETARRNAELRAAQATIGTPAARAAYDRARRS